MNDKKEYKVLGNYINSVDIRNRDLGVQKLLGVSISKKFIPSIANIVGTDLSNYKVVRRGQFAYGPVTSRNGERISIAFLDEDDCIISSSYSVFEVNKPEELDAEYLMLWFSRQEFDRYARYKSHGSVRELFDWNELCQVELPIPNINKQQKIVKAYKAVTNRIAIKQQINDNLVETANAIFCNFFISNQNREKWKTGSFSKFLIDTSGGDWGQEAPSGNYTFKVSCIRGTDIPSLNSGSISDAPTRYILPKNFDEKRIQTNNMVVEISGGSPVQATGRIALVPDTVLKYRGDNLICSNFCRVLKVNEDYLYYFLQYWLYLYRNGVMFNFENSSTGLKNFNFTAFAEEHPIEIPPIELSKGFNELLRPIYTQIFKIGFEIEHLKDTLAYILPQIISCGLGR